MCEQPPALVEVVARGGSLDTPVQRQERALPLGVAGRRLQPEGGSSACDAEHPAGEPFAFVGLPAGRRLRACGLRHAEAQQLGTERPPLLLFFRELGYFASSTPLGAHACNVKSACE